MKTKYCSVDCGESYHTAICINKRRDAGEFDLKVDDRIKKLEQDIEELRNLINKK